MPPASSAKLRRLTGTLAVLCIGFVLLLQGKPYFTNAARPPRGIPDPGVALQVARDSVEIDDILSDVPSPDREVMRVKQYIDFGFIVSYTGLFIALALVLSEPSSTGPSGSWRRVLAFAVVVCALGTAVFDILENAAILRILDIPLHSTTSAMINAIREPSAAKWVLSAVTLFVLSALLLPEAGWLKKIAGALMVSSAVLILYGLRDNRFLVYQGYPGVAALASIAAAYFRVR